MKHIWISCIHYLIFFFSKGYFTEDKRNLDKSGLANRSLAWWRETITELWGTKTEAISTSNWKFSVPSGSCWTNAQDLIFLKITALSFKRKFFRNESILYICKLISTEKKLLQLRMFQSGHTLELNGCNPSFPSPILGFYIKRGRVLFFKRKEKYPIYPGLRKKKVRAWLFWAGGILCARRGESIW